ncbi:MAG TPA: SusD/RagB family nutrient-binding outer membrane lipoprotein, partial [Gemmatimonadaceae bacterium]|nr:SusD/RagB family nutrient-binding outer membrane lipoprotein [Gemmatimonadaceae bacterium]
MISRKLNLVVGVLAAVGVAACNNDKITEVNENPNSPTDAPTGTLFTNAARLTAARFLDGVGGTRYAFLAQHMAEVQYPESDDYRRLRGNNAAGLFSTPYNTELQDLMLVIGRGVAANQPGTYGPALVLKAWEFGHITDIFGDVPYTEAFRADSGVLAPKYDEQKTVYTGIFADLDKASKDLASASNTLGTSDPIYGGVPAKWQKFANSVRARHALRLVNVDRATAEAQLRSALGGAGGLITSNADNALIRWPGDGVYDNPWAANFKTRDDHRVSERLIRVLQEYNDPRITVFAMAPDRDAEAVAGRTIKWCPTGFTTTCYIGLINALTHSQASPLVPTTSRIGGIFYPGATAYGNYGGGGSSRPSPLFQASEALFIQAEAAARGLAGLTAAQANGFFQAGIRASMEFYGIPEAQIAAYLASPAGTLAAGNAGLIQIATQKWIA